MSNVRFDKREDLDKVICDFLDRDGSVEGLDVTLSRMGAVDLDLLVDCLNEMKHRMAAAALADMKAESSFNMYDTGMPLRIVA